MNLAEYSENGIFAPRKIAGQLRTSADEVARTLGLSKDALQRTSRRQSPRTQRRLRGMIEILNRVEPRFGSALIAYAWYRSEPLAGFGGQTAMQLVREGRADEVMTLIDAVVRLQPGALGHQDSAHHDSFSPGAKRLLDHPHYTRPRTWEGMDAPEVLLSGNHAKIEAWRQVEALKRTQERRPDLLEDESLT